MKRTLSSAQTTVPPETLTDPNGLEENLPDPSWIEESFPGTPSEQTSSEPKLLNRSAIDSSTLIPVDLNGSCDVKDQHSAPEKSDRSTSATSTATSATNNDEIEALEKFPLSAGTEVPFKLDLCYDFGQDIELSKEKIFKTVEKAALNDDVYAQASLAMMYESGLGIEVDKAKAFEWYHKAADQGDVFAQFKLGEMYRTGEGVAVDKVKAVEWYHKAADQGNLDAQFRLAELYQKGEGVEIDDAKAFEWYQKAARQGDTNSQEELTEAYRNGVGVAKNLQLATYWMLKPYVSTASFNYESIELLDYVPAALLKFPDLRSINLIHFHGLGRDEEIASIAKFIRTNSSIKSLNLSFQNRLSDDQVGELYARLDCCNTR